MAEIKNCTLHTENEEDGIDIILEGGGTQRVSANGTIGIGAISGTDVEISMIVGGQVVQRRTVFMFPGDNPYSIATTLGDPITNPLLPDAPGSVDVDIEADPVGGTTDRVRCGTLRIRKGFSASNVNLVSGTCTTAPSNIGEGDLVEFSADVENRNPLDATVSVSFTADGATIVTQSGITVPAESTHTVRQSATWSFVESRVGTGAFAIRANLTSITESTSLAAALRGATAGVDRRTLAVAGAGAGAGLVGLRLAGR